VQPSRQANPEGKGGISNPKSQPPRQQRRQLSTTQKALPRSNERREDLLPVIITLLLLHPALLLLRTPRRPARGAGDDIVANVRVGYASALVFVAAPGFLGRLEEVVGGVYKRWRGIGFWGRGGVEGGR